MRVVWLLHIEGEDPDKVRAAGRRLLIWALAVLAVLAVLVLGFVALLLGRSW